MASKTLCLVLFCGLLSPFLVEAGPNDMVPVLLWAGASSSNSANPLQKTSRAEFETVLSKNLGKDLPPIVVFVKENFCVEDITHNKKSLQQLTKLGNLIYLPSVESAYSVFENLPNYNISREETIEAVTDSHLVIVELTDLDGIPDMYKVAQESSNNLVVAVTGKACSYSNPEKIKRSMPNLERSKRQVEKEEFLISGENVLMYADKYPMIKTKALKDWVNLGKPDKPEITAKDSVISVAIPFSNIKDVKNFKLTFEFKNNGLGYYVLNRTLYEPSDEQPKALMSSNDIYFPHDYSWHCSQESIFTYREFGKDTEIFISFPNLQVQVGKGNIEKFGSSYDCTGFTSIPIWAGIFVTAILAIIMIWGLSMILDIRTMDRFDDPKGKTITITNVD